MAGSDTDFHTGHRERLRQKFLDGKLADYELLEMLLGYAIPRRDVRPLARGLMAQFGGVHQILSAPLDKLVAFRGMGRNTAIFLKSINQIIPRKTERTANLSRCDGGCKLLSHDIVRQNNRRNACVLSGL